jgi:phosphatidate cytidylyltransferase
VNWKSFSSRMLLISIAFPVLISLVFLLSWLNHLALNIVVVGVTIVGAFETEAMVRKRGIPTSRWFAPLFAGVLPALTYLEVAGILPPEGLHLGTALVFAVVLVRSIVFQRTAILPDILSFVSSSFFVVLYPGFFLTFFVRLSSLPSASILIAFFLSLVFGNDMAAYFAGSLWGDSTRLGLPVSPQKSVVGFAAGIAGSLIVVMLYHFIAPGQLPFTLPMRLLIGIALGLLTIIGDLIESGMKRSAGVKDSGIAIPGRGGVLDSVDSMMLAAPLFYYILSMGIR